MNKEIVLIYSKHSPFPHSIGVPLTIFSLGGVLEKEGYKVEYFDERIHKFKLLKEYLKKNPLFIGLSSMTSFQIVSSIFLSKKIRKINPFIPLVWGGVHPSMLPIQTAKSKYVDFVIKGEGEATIVELANELNRPDPNFKRIKGLVWKKKDAIIVNKDREFVDLNKLPQNYNYAAKKMLPCYIEKDKKIIARQPVFYVTSRGCPFNCIFCYNRIYNKNKWRPKDINLVKKELEELKGLGVEKIFFADDNLAVTRDRLLSICEVTKELRLKWSACARINYIDKDTASILEESGCEYLLFGIESGSEKILKYIRKDITIDEIKRCVNILAKTNIVGMYSFMFGFPNETEEDMKKSFDLIDYIITKDPKAEIQLQIYTPFPGTPLYEIALKEGFKPPEKLEDWSNFVMDEVNVPWINKEKSRLLKNLYVISVFAFRQKEFLKNKLFFLPHLIAKWRWKKRYFKWSYERIIYDLIKLFPWLK